MRLPPRPYVVVFLLFIWWWTDLLFPALAIWFLWRLVTGPFVYAGELQTNLRRIAAALDLQNQTPSRSR